MTRLTHLVTALALAGIFTGATVAACGGHRTSPGEMQPLAPRPETVRPNAMPAPGALSGKNTRSPIATGPAVPQPSPVYQAAGAQPLGDQPSGAALDAGTSDSGAAPLPPLRDGSVPADSRMEPILQRDGGR